MEKLLAHIFWKMIPTKNNIVNQKNLNKLNIYDY